MMDFSKFISINARVTATTLCSNIRTFFFFWKSLIPNYLGAILLQLKMWQLKKLSICNFSHMIFSMNHVTYLKKYT